MEKLDFSKYSGSYNLNEIQKVLDEMEIDILNKKKEIACKKAQEIHGDNYFYSVKKGVSVDLRKLEKNQRICGCIIKGHHILMTEKDK